MYYVLIDSNFLLNENTPLQKKIKNDKHPYGQESTNLTKEKHSKYHGKISKNQILLTFNPSVLVKVCIKKTSHWKNDINM